MQTLEVSKREWPAYLDRLTQSASDRPVHLEVENLELGDQEMVESSPLKAILQETEGSAAGAIEIRVGGSTGELSHRIAQPTQLFALVGDRGELSSLSIADAEGGKTLLIFEERPPVVDDVGPSARRAGAPTEQASAP
jgi:hypothetical protein